MRRPSASRTARRQKQQERFSFSLYETDRKALADLVALLGDHGLELDRTQVVRGLLSTSSDLDLFASAVLQHREDSLREGGRREKSSVAERFSIEKLGDSAEKLDRVIAQLVAKGIPMNESYVLRALLRHLPPFESLVPVFRTYVEENPDGRTLAAILRRKNA